MALHDQKALISTWIDTIRCPDCRKSRLSLHGDGLTCPDCGRRYDAPHDIWNLLPERIENQTGKELEKEGWTQKSHSHEKSGTEPPDSHYLSLPDHPHPYYAAAAWYLKIVMEMGRPWKGKRVLELGAAECWATRRFAEAGAEAAALDYDPTRMRKGQILLDNLPITFLRLRGDAERLPFSDNSLDAVFCCSVLHHFFNIAQAIREIGRVLKPGGRFFGIHEAFHPPYYSRERILAMSEDTIPNIAAGINECSYTPAQYRRWFQAAGCDFDLIHPAWDVRMRPNGGVMVDRGGQVSRNPGFQPFLLANRAWRQDMVGVVSRAILASRIWKVLTHHRIFPLIRFWILNLSTKDKLIVAGKN